MTFKDPKALFPTPARPPIDTAPVRWPGITPGSTEVLLNALKDNHVKHHIFFNDRGFHNHATHHLLAIWGMGASGPVIDAVYQTHVRYQRPAVESPEPITRENLYDHLADEKYYQAYLKFFRDELEKKGCSAVLEEHIFAEKANYDQAREKAGKPQGEMLNRFLAGLVHPMIHTGYGVEFGLNGQIAEGLAQTATHNAELTELINGLLPGQWFPQGTETTSRLSSLMSSLKVGSTTSEQTGPSIHAFDALVRILKDSDANIPRARPQDALDAIRPNSEFVLRAVEGWFVDGSDEADVEEKTDQLIWLTSLLYAIGGWSAGKEFNADFLLMHLVTSSAFLSSISAALKPESKALFLRSYLGVALGWYIARGRPQLPIAEFFAPDSSAKIASKVPGAHPTPSKETIPAPDSPDALNPNPFLGIVQSSLVHPNEHLCKIVRALENNSRLYGSLSSSDLGFGKTELPGADKLDGTLFVRAATLTMDKLGWMREGQEKQEWDFKGFYTSD